MEFKYVVVGAGISGLTVAERIANELKQKVLVIEKRKHIGGNCYDFYDKDGILIHKYGPHIFHTNERDVWEYLNKFTAFDMYQHRVLTYVDGMLMPMPICAKTVNMLYGQNLTNAEIADFLRAQAQPQREIKTSEDVVLKNAGDVIYEKFFKHYTKKQWGVYPSELDSSVISRVPVRTNGDERYFTDKYQGMPVGGYTQMFRRMVQNDKITLLVGQDYKSVLSGIKYEKLIYSGPVDHYFDYCEGTLKYRSVNFEFETHDTDSFQEISVINYPNEYDFTRITEYKKLTGQQHKKTVISKEFPTDEGEPCYPFPNNEGKELYEKYKKLADAQKNVYFVGRLAQYKYYNMDAAVKSALDLYGQIKSEEV